MSRRKKGEPAPDIVLPITPMLDMAFQLLTFFIFTYHPSGMEGQMELNLPSESATQAHEKKDESNKATPDKNVNLELPTDLLVVIETAKDAANIGILSNIRVEERSGKTPIDSLPALQQHLEKVRDTVENKTAVKLQADDRLKWQEVVKVMDVCRKAGFNNISFAPPPLYGQSGVN